MDVDAAAPGPVSPRLTVALTVDTDFISDAVRRGDSPVKFSHGEFGARVGMPRLLQLFARESIPATVFAPGHSLVTFPELARAIVEGGHEIAAHGWYHEDFATLPRKRQRAILEFSSSAIETLTGSRPAGFRAPYWSLGPRTLELVEASGFVYDSSLMADDYQLHRVRHGDRHSVESGTSWGPEGRLVEVPVYWALDDWPLFEPAAGGHDGLSAPSRALEIWTAELRYAHDHAPGGLLTVTVHPECIGRGHRMAMLERFIAEAKGLPGVRFARLHEYVAAWIARSDAGVPEGSNVPTIGAWDPEEVDRAGEGEAGPVGEGDTGAEGDPGAEGDSGAEGDPGPGAEGVQAAATSPAGAAPEPWSPYAGIGEPAEPREPDPAIRQDVGG
jgi:peptidoglycan/xylan/chitin deacetylase (PgdA/CDA1 family)